MSRKRSDESRILEYFEGAELAKTEVVLELAKTITKRRQEIDQRIVSVKSGGQPKPVAKRRKRRTKAEMEAARAAVHQTKHETEEEHIPF